MIYFYSQLRIHHSWRETARGHNKPLRRWSAHGPGGFITLSLGIRYPSPLCCQSLWV